MNIREFSLNLQKVYEEMSETFSRFQASTGLSCLSGCGKCCLNPVVEASTLEMLPLALKIYEEGKLEEWLEILSNSQQEHCLLYHDEGNGKGYCTVYSTRPSLCRMFGVSGYLNKSQQVTLSICKSIKDAQPQKALSLKENPPQETPLMANWSRKLATLEPRLIQDRKPINLAFKEALEKVALYAQYQNL